MKFLLLANERFPTNRPMLRELLNKEFPLLGNELQWVMQSRHKFKSIKFLDWINSSVLLLPNVGIKYVDFVIGFLLKFVSSLYLGIIEKYDFIIGHDGALDGLIGVFIKKFFGINLVFIISGPLWDFEKENLIEYKGWKKRIRFLRYQFFNKIYNFVFYESDVVHPISDSMSKKYFNNKIKDKSFPISESGTMSFIKNFDMSSRLNTRDFYYIGTFGVLRELEFLINSFKLVADKNKKARLILVGWSDHDGDQKRLVKCADENGISSRVKFIPKVEYSKLPELLNKAFAGVSPIPPKKIYMISTPTKVIDYMSLGLPTVCNKEIMDQSNLINYSSGGLTPSYKEKEFSKAMIWLINNPKEARRMGLNARKWILEKRNYKNLALDLNHRYNKLIS